VNDPFAGGTHLPDVTLVMGVFGRTGPDADAETRRNGDAETRGHGDAETRRHGDTETGGKNHSPSPRLRVSPSPRSLYFVANRAHHADIGGATPGSMGLAT